MPLRNIFFIALSVIISLACYSVAAKNRHATLFAEALELVETKALQQVPRDKLFDSAMKGMMLELDDHSTFISGEQFKLFNDDMRQQFGGVGMYVDNDTANEKLVVLAPIPNTPAYEAGVEIGDEILEIDGRTTEGLGRAEAIKLMRGPVGKSVDIVLGRAGERVSVSLKRASIEVPSVHGDWRNPDGSWNFKVKEEPNIGYVRLLQFGDRSTSEIKSALEKVNGKVDGLILDLRNNSGGLLVSAIEICDMFLEDQDLPIVSTKHRAASLNSTYSSTAGSTLNPSTPVVGLVNRNSASASEILAACLQDHDRAVVIGEQSWGKRTVQNVIPMQRDKSVLKLTTASYWRPSGVQIDRNDENSKKTGVWGVQPNEGFEIEMTEAELFENIRQRSIRDLMGLRRDGAEVPKTQLMLPREDVSKADENSNTPEEDLGDEDDGTQSEDDGDAGGKRDPTKPYVDRALQRAIEHFRDLLSTPVPA